MPGEILQGLGDNGGIGQDWHEVSVSEPARDDVDVEVFQNAGTGDFAEVDADIEAIGFHDFGQGILTTTRELQEIGHFVVCEAIQVGNLFVGHGHQVAAGVGVGVEQGETGAVTEDDKIGFVIVGLGDLSEEAFG